MYEVYEVLEDGLAQSVVTSLQHARFAVFLNSGEMCNWHVNVSDSLGQAGASLIYERLDVPTTSHSRRVKSLYFFGSGAKNVGTSGRT